MMARMQRDDVSTTFLILGIKLSFSFWTLWLHKVRRRESVLKDIADAKINKIRNQTVCKKMGCLTPEKRARLKVCDKNITTEIIK